MDGNPEAQLLESIAREHEEGAPSRAATVLSDAIRANHAGAVVGILFYGSCLRRGVEEGVHDFYVLVDSYRAAYPGLRLRFLNWLLPPNVFYLEAHDAGRVYRAKYAVISVEDFARTTAPRSLHPYVWARFAQPSLLVWAREPQSRSQIYAWLGQSCITMVQCLSVFMPAHGPRQRYSLAALWHEALRRTYSAELRGEQPETIRQLYEVDARRYDEIARLALRVLASEGVLDSVEERGGAVETHRRQFAISWGRWRWHLARPIAKSLAFIRLLKSAMTFGDWLPYILWKVERHSGQKVEVTDRQRKHPILLGLPVLVRLVRQGVLR